MLAARLMGAREDIGVESSEVLQEILRRYPTKILARAADVSLDVARRWRDSGVEPATGNFFRLAAAFPDVRAFALASMGMTDPEFMADQPAHAVNQYLQQQREK